MVETQAPESKGVDEMSSQRRSSPSVRGRYAPSPTGPLHLGNVRTALLAWLQVREQDGTLVLRIEDLDAPRVREGSTEEILFDLDWLGLDWDEGPGCGGSTGPFFQSERTAFYRDALRDLEDRGLAFRCLCSRRDVQEAASAPHGPSNQVIYPGTCRGLTQVEFEAMQRDKPNRLPAWRFVVQHTNVISVTDRVCGAVAQDLSVEVGDFVIRRADDLFAYQLAVVVDDALMGITDVVRGEDLLDSTPRQIALFEALHYPVPRFWHVPLMCDKDGERLSKRDGSQSVAELRAKGWRPADIIGHLAATLGWVEPQTPISARELCDARCFTQTWGHP